MNFPIPSFDVYQFTGMSPTLLMSAVLASNGQEARSIVSRALFIPVTSLIAQQVAPIPDHG